MAKSVEIAKARRKKQAQAQARKEREMWNKVRKPLMIAVAAAAVLLISWIVYSNFIYLPTNGVRVANGALSGADSSWVVANFGTSGKPECIHMASYQAPAGYTLDTSGTVSSSSLTQSLYYKADDPTAVIQTIYVAGVAGQKPDAMVEKLLGNGFFTNSERVENTVLAGFPVACLYSQTGSTNEKGQTVQGVGTASLYVYTDAIRDSSCVVVLTTGSGKTEELPAAADLLAVAEPCIKGLTLTK